MAHLIRRFLESLSDDRPTPGDVDLIRQFLTSAEFGLWSCMGPADQRHSVKVLSRFLERLPDASTGELAGVALHDVGKISSRLGTVGRVLATVVGPRTRRFSLYRDHESIGAKLLREIGAAQDAIAVLEGTARPETMAAYRWADRY